MQKHPEQLEYILGQKILADTFSQQLTNWLKEYEYTAEILYKENNIYRPKIYLPKDFDSKDKESTLAKYFEDPNAQPSTLEAITFDQQKSPNLRDCATATYETRIAEIFGSTSDQHVYADQKKCESEAGTPFGELFWPEYLTEEFIHKTSPLEIMKIFQSLRFLLTNDGQITAVDLNNICRPNHPNQFDDINMHFMLASTTSDYFIGKYICISNKTDLQIEPLIQWFLNEYISNTYKLKLFDFTAPPQNTPLYQKNILLASAIERILSQYSEFCGSQAQKSAVRQKVSKPTGIENVKSILHNKYLTMSSNELKREAFLLHSRDSFLFASLTDKFAGNCFFDIITTHEIHMNDIDLRLYDILAFLSNHGSIWQLPDGNIKANLERCTLLSRLHNKGAVNKYKLTQDHYPIVDELIKTKQLECHNSLLSRNEQTFYNYTFNKKDVVNGLDLRNIYAHGKYSIDSVTNFSDYIQFCTWLIIISLKIWDELETYNKFTSQ